MEHFLTPLQNIALFAIVLAIHVQVPSILIVLIAIPMQAKEVMENAVVI